MGAYRELFDDWYEIIYGTALAYAKVHEIAEDVLQQVFLKIWERREEMGAVSNPAGWIHTAARYQVLHVLEKEWSKQKYFHQTASQINDITDRPDNQMIRQEQHATLQQLIQSLPARQLQVYRLSREEGLSYAEIAARLGIGKETVKEHMAKALSTLRELLTAHKDFLLSSGILFYYFFC